MLCSVTNRPRGDGERCVTPARAAAKETNRNTDNHSNCLHGNVL